ncbi:MAG TPA: phosphatase PAP2 family protein [Streptosporangiaceae bacterium]
MRLHLQAPDSARSAVRAPDRPHPAGDRKVVAIRLAGGLVLLFGLIWLIGFLLTHYASAGPAHRADLSVDKWLAARRSGAWNTTTLVGTTMAQTETVIGIAIVVVLFCRWQLGRWYESLFMVAVMAGELVVFLGTTELVHQARPPVARLDPAPPTSSYPSGHTAAAVALYGGIAVLALWVYGRRPATRIAAVVLACVPVFVGFSRLYRGMHYPSDVLAGALLGGAWLLIVTTTLLPRTAGQRLALRRSRPAGRPRAARAP